MSLTKGRTISVCLCMALLALPAPAALGDTVTLEGEREPVKGEITKETIKGIVMTVGGGAKTFTRQQIAPDGIAYDGKPQQLTDGQEALRGRRYQEAHRHFRNFIAVAQSAMGGEGKANGKGKKAPAKAAPKSAAVARAMVFYQHALWHEVLTFDAEGNKPATIAAIDDLLETYPDSWFLQEALLLKVRRAIEVDAAKANAFIEDSIARAEKQGAGEEISDRIKLIQADNLAKAGKKPDAMKVWQTLTKSPVKSVSDQAKLSIALDGVTGGNAVTAKMTFNELLRSSKDRSVLCGAARGLGDAQMKEAGAEMKVESLREALESYLKSIVSYFPAQGDPTENHQAALVQAAKCAENLMKSPEIKKNAKAQEGYRTLARDLYRELSQAYPRTPAAEDAANALQRLSSGKAD